MKKTFLLWMLCCALMACKKNSIDFSYSPETPRAGETVTFSNLSTSGEEWEWTFGDGSTATLKSPTHVYKKPGTYRVVLKVDKKTSWTATKEITVFDTVPTFVCEDSVFTIYTDYTFTANVYNPYNYAVTYLWSLGDAPDAVVPDGELGNRSLHLYFTRESSATPIALTVVLNGDTTQVHKTFAVADKFTNAVVMRTQEGDWRQRIFGDRAEAAKPATDSRTDSLLGHEQDTLQAYNDSTFRLSALSATFPGIEGFHIASRKIYYRADGLWVANIDGANAVRIDSLACTAMTLDLQDNRVYWANENGVWYMPFVGSDNNRFVTEPQHLNELTNVFKLAADN